MELETIEGEVLSFRRVNPTFCLVSVRGPKRQTLKLIGTMGDMVEGMKIKAYATPQEHATWGMQYKVVTYDIVGFKGLDSIIEYLSSSRFPGIGRVFAKQLVNKYGDQLLTHLTGNADYLIENAQDMNVEKLKKLITLWKEQSLETEAVAQLMKMGLDNHQALRAWQHFGCKVISIIEDNYYSLSDVPRIGFEAADRIALQNGVDRYSPLRVVAAIKFHLNQIIFHGHCYEDMDELSTEVIKLLHYEINDTQFLDGLKVTIQNGDVVREESKIYLASVRQKEQSVARKINSLLNYQLSPLYSNIETMRKDIDTYCDMGPDFELSDEQEQALYNAFTNQFSIITGGPGVGKTTVTKIIFDILRAKSDGCICCAPTGRAAKRLAQATKDVNSCTIHRLLESNKGLGFLRNADFPLEVSCVIVDESSMVDLFLFYALLEALPDRVRLIMIGDVNQLPSVGPGNILKDLINCKKITTIYLNKIYRQTEGSTIVSVAHDILHGNLLNLPSPNTKGKSNCIFIACDTVERTIAQLVSLVTKSFPSIEVASQDVQILTPMRVKGLGINDLNPILQESLNPATEEKNSIEIGKIVYRVGDRVMQISNNYEKAVFNGDVGEISSIDASDPSNPVVCVNYPDMYYDVTYAKLEIEQIQHAFASTIHKSQGCEYPYVILILHTIHGRMLQRNLFYTALTRAKKMCIIIGHEDAVKEAVSNNSQTRRKTSLKELINAQN